MKQSNRILLLIILFTMFTASLSATVELQAGTRIQLTCLQTLSSEYIVPGQSVRFNVANDVIVEKNIVIPKSTEALARVVSVEPNGIVGKPGSLVLQFDSVRAIDGTVVPITATKIVNGKDAQTEAILVTLILCVFGLFIQGEDATINVGTIVEATTLSDTDIDSELEALMLVKTENNSAKMVVKGMQVEVITHNAKRFMGSLSSKEKNKIYVLKDNDLTIIDSKNILNIYDVFDGSEITDDVFNMADFLPSRKYNWNSLNVKEID